MPLSTEPQAGDIVAPSPLPPAVALGLDPGLRRTGYAVLSAARISNDAVIREAGVIATAPRAALARRLAELHEALKTILANHGPALIACEQLYAHYRHPRTAILMGHARGVLLATAGAAGIPVIAIAATNAKKMLTGNGHAGKAQMQRAIMSTLRLAHLPEPHDVADALAIGLCGLITLRQRIRATDTASALSARHHSSRNEQ